MELDIEKIAQAVGYVAETVNDWLGLEKMFLKEFPLSMEIGLVR